MTVDGTSTCPLCGEYTGKPASVEAHITGKSDETHKGRTGNEFREEIRGTGPGQVPSEDLDREANQPRPSEGLAVEERDDEDRDDTVSLLFLGFLAALIYWLLGLGRDEDQVEDLYGPGPR